MTEYLTLIIWQINSVIDLLYTDKISIGLKNVWSYKAAELNLSKILTFVNWQKYSNMTWTSSVNLILEVTFYR